MTMRQVGLGWLVGGLLCGVVGTATVARAEGGSYVEQWGPAIGSPVPMLDARDQDGERRSFENLTGEHGLLLFFSRSTDW